MNGLCSVCVVLLMAASNAYCYELNILHINDVHAHIDGTSRSSGLCRSSSSCYGGIARVVAKVKELKASNPNVIFLNAGDMFQGTPYFTKFKSEAILEFANEMRFDAQALGNHEFDAGIPELTKYLKQVNAPVVCCNLDLTLEPTLQAQRLTDSIILNVGGAKVGIVGFLTRLIYPGARGKVKILPEVPSLQNATALLRKSGAQIVIGLGHSGYEVELDIAKNVEGLDAVVGGHSHTFLLSGELEEDFDIPTGPYPTMVTQANGKMIPVVQAFQFTKYLGHLKLEFDDDFRLINASGNPIILRPDLPRDDKILVLQQKWDRNMTDMFELAGEFKGDVEGGRKFCRFGECGMGNFIADALQTYALKNVNESDVITIFSAGMIRSSIEKGNATVGEVSSILLYGEAVAVVHVSGSTLINAVESTVKGYDSIEGSPNFLQTAGMEVKFDLSKPQGSRIVSARTVGSTDENSTDINVNSTYTVVMPKRLLFAYKMANTTIIHEPKNTVTQILLEYLKSRGRYVPDEIGKRIQVIKG